MDPNKPYQNSPESNPYEFILNPQQPSKPKRLGSASNNKFLLTIVLIIGGVFVLMIIVAILLNALAPKKVSKEQLIGLSQTQTELIRVSEQGSTASVQQVTRNLAATIQYSMKTQRKQTLDTLAKNNVEVSDKLLALKQNAQTDQQLASAKSTSTYDAAFTEIVETQLKQYAATLQQLTEQGASKTERDQMSEYYRQTQLLISQIPYTQDTIESAGTVQ